MVIVCIARAAIRRLPTTDTDSKIGDWQATFQKIPTLTDNLFEEHGAKRLAPRGYADAANGDIFNDFDKWTDHALWPAVSKEYGAEGMNAPEDTELDIEITTHTRSSNLRQDVSEAIVEDVKVLTAPGESEKRHLELRLPSDMSFKTGDYLAVLPINHTTIVKRVMNRFGLAWDSKFIVKEGQNTLLPAGRDMSVFAALSAYLEFNQPATVKVGLTFPLPIYHKTDCYPVERCSHCQNYSRRSYTYPTTHSI